MVINNIEAISWVNNYNVEQKREQVELSFAKQDGSGLFDTIVIFTKSLNATYFQLKPYIPRGILMIKKARTPTKDSIIDNKCLIQRIIITNDEIFWSKYPIDQRYTGHGIHIAGLIEFRDNAIEKKDNGKITENLLKGRYGY